MEQRLERMAARGWLLERATSWGWTYRRAEPGEARYTVAYFPAASVFDSGPTDEQRTYADYCQAAGWELAAANGPLQFFRSTRPNPTPIDTDEATKLDTVRRTMRKSLLLPYGLLLAIWSLNLFTRLDDFRRRPLSLLSSNSSLALLALLAFLVVYLAAVLVDYGVWAARSRRRVAEGGRCLPTHSRARLAGGAVGLGLAGLMLLAFFTELSTPGGRLILLYTFGGMALIIGLSQGLMALLKKRGASRGAVRGWFFAACVLLAVVYSAGMLPLAGVLGGSGLLREGQPAEVYTDSRGWTWDIYRDDLPVTLEHLGFPVTGADHCTYTAEESRSILLTDRQYVQRAMARDSQLPELSYRVVEIPWGWLRGLVLRRWTQARAFQPVEDPRWGADAVYQSELGAGHSNPDWVYRDFLLVYGDQVVYLETDWVVTPARLAEAFHPARS